MEIFDKVKAILSELNGAESIEPEHELQKDLGLDSLQMVMLLLLLEENFEIILEESDMDPFALTTVQHIVDLIEKYIKKDEEDEKIYYIDCLASADGGM